MSVGYFSSLYNRGRVDDFPYVLERKTITKRLGARTGFIGSEIRGQERARLELRLDGETFGTIEKKETMYSMLRSRWHSVPSSFRSSDTVSRSTPDPRDWPYQWDRHEGSEPPEGFISLFDSPLISVGKSICYHFGFSNVQTHILDVVVVVAVPAIHVSAPYGIVHHRVENCDRDHR